jgi:hypothetical protein
MPGQRLPHKHYPDPEILPPDSETGTGREESVWPGESGQAYGKRRIYVTKVSPLAFLPFILVITAAGAAVAFLVFGLLLVLLPIAGVILAGALIANALRPPERLR